MNALISLHNSVFERLERAEWLLPTLARLVFVAVLFIYYWNSATLKIDGSIFSPSAGAFGQMFPKAAEEALYNVEALTGFQRLVIFAGTVAEFVLPVLILIGLLTRLAALGTIGFVFVQTVVDVTGHGAKLGTLFDTSIGLIDERVMWIFLLIVIAVKGAGPLSLDRLLSRKSA
ncbi:DoxX family protein [Roseovarius faecimaris]|uniref:DoxX family protein n=1 Tax=Roseovarius faecimaris TaxID=2494550 RepID=A0A6I6IYX8_9RHOB|nr:DoxX family protein [Roseovarius faecimaris]QGX97838.1 DoxX family protein [Roseovarius faecimaris]